MEKNLKKALKVLIFLAVFVVLYFILRKIGFANIYNNLLIADKKYLLLSFLSAFAVFLTWNFKWYLLVKEIVEVKFHQLFMILMASSFVNTTTPGARVGGEPLRAYYLSKQYKIEKAKFFATALIDKAINTIAFAVLSVFSILFVILFMDIDAKIRLFLEIMLVVLFLLIVTGIALRRKMVFKRKYITDILKKIYYFSLFKTVRKKFLSYKKFENYIIRKLNNVINTLKRILKQKKVFKKDLALAFVRWFFNYLATYFLFRAFGYDVSFIAVIIVVTLSILIGSMLVLPGGMGIIETIMISLYLSFGINPGVAATVAVIDRFIFYFYSLFIGGICLAYLNIRYK